MSTFKVDVRKISNVWEHDNADALELASVEGMSFQFVVQKGKYSEGDLVVYFPVDSVMPEDLIETCGLTGRLSGSKKNRIKTVRLRGRISQGFVIKLRELANHIPSDVLNNLSEGDDLTDILGVVKYEVPEIKCKSGRLCTLPEGVGIYDIEGADRYPGAVEEMKDLPVWITEKLEGTNWSLTLTSNGKFFVNTRRHSVVEIEEYENDYWKVARTQNMFDIAEQLLKDIAPEQHLTLRGELIGPGWQKNIYNLSKHEVRLFDVKFDGRYLDSNTLLWLADKYGFDNYLVPTLSAGIRLQEVLGGKTVQEFSDGESVLFKTKREGVVIKPMIEKYSEALKGRLIIKQRGPEYLASTNL